MQIHKATLFQFVMVHTNFGFFKVDNLGGIHMWDETSQLWKETDSLPASDIAILVEVALAKFNNPQFRH